MIEPAEASDLAVKVFSKSVSHGFAGLYRFYKQSGSDGVRILFLDCGREITSFQRFLMTSIVLSALGLLLIFGIVVYFSGRIVRPFAESYEKQKQFITDAGHEIKTLWQLFRRTRMCWKWNLGKMSGCRIFRPTSSSCPG